MKIKRIVDGKELTFELTHDEMYSAHSEMQHSFDMDDIMSEIHDCLETYDDEEYADTDTIRIDGENINVGKLRGLYEDEQEISAMASVLRKWLDGNDYISECLWQTCKAAIASVYRSRYGKQEAKVS